jgi:hypothetical protein
MLRVMSAGSMGHRWSGTFTFWTIFIGKTMRPAKSSKTEGLSAASARIAGRGVSFNETMTGED